jgi:hypothetical protein
MNFLKGVGGECILLAKNFFSLALICQGLLILLDSHGPISK